MISAAPNEATRPGAYSHLRSPHGDRRREGFTFVEILVAISIGAAVLATAVVCFQAIGASGNRLGAYGAVTMQSTAVLTNFYGTNMDANSVRTWFAPNYGRLANVEMMREKFHEDVQRAVAVYCLPREGLSATRPTTIPFSGVYDLADFDARRLDTSEAFREFLATAIPASAGTFSTNAFAGTGTARGQNLSIFVLISSDDPTALTVHAIYEVDFAPASSPSGTYAAVRRYQGEEMTDYYDAFYADLPDGTAVLPDDFYVAASFERAGRPTTTTVAENEVAASQPFYFVWWPDPASPTLPSSGTDYLESMPGQTSYMMVVPMFPAL